MDMHMAKLGAAVQRREDLAGVEPMRRVEGAFDPLLLFQIDFGKHLAHQVAFFDTNPMLAGQHPANLDAQLQNVRTKFLGTFDLTVNGCIIQDERMQIAIPGMKHIGDAQPVLFGKLSDALENMGQF